MPAVWLTWSEMLIATNIAAMRRIFALKANCGSTHGSKRPADEGAWEPDFFSCQSELAVAKYLNLFWSGSVGDVEGIDVGGCVEVRTIRSSDHRLRLHEDDKDHLPYVLVYATPPLFDLRGWCYARDGKQRELWSDPTGANRPAYWIPQNSGLLRPVSELREIVCDRRLAEAAT